MHRLKSLGISWVLRTSGPRRLPTPIGVWAMLPDTKGCGKSTSVAPMPTVRLRRCWASGLSLKMRCRERSMCMDVRRLDRQVRVIGWLVLIWKASTLTSGRWMKYRQSLLMRAPSHGCLPWMILPLGTALLLGFSRKVGLKKYCWDALWRLMEWTTFVIMYCICPQTMLRRFSYSKSLCEGSIRKWLNWLIPKSRFQLFLAAITGP